MSDGTIRDGGNNRFGGIRLSADTEQQLSVEAVEGILASLSDVVALGVLVAVAEFEYSKVDAGAPVIRIPGGPDRTLSAPEALRFVRSEYLTLKSLSYENPIFLLLLLPFAAPIIDALTGFVVAMSKLPAEREILRQTALKIEQDAKVAAETAELIRVRTERERVDLEDARHRVTQDHQQMLKAGAAHNSEAAATWRQQAQTDSQRVNELQKEVDEFTSRLDQLQLERSRLIGELTELNERAAAPKSRPGRNALNQIASQATSDSTISETIAALNDEQPTKNSLEDALEQLSEEIRDAQEIVTLQNGEQFGNPLSKEDALALIDAARLIKSINVVRDISPTAEAELDRF
ncbi:hypothetical protein BH09ACT6_BH09ACT6_15120 [soil metagenome]